MKTKMINWRYIFYPILLIGFLFDIIEEGSMGVGIILGWLIGLMTATQWDIERNEQENKK